MHDLNFSLQFYCSDKYSVTTVCTAETGKKWESETREENICGPSVPKLQVEFLSICIIMDEKILFFCVCIYTHTHMYVCAHTHFGRNAWIIL